MAVIGVGHLGKEHARILSTLPEVELVGVVDARPEQASIIAERCHTKAFQTHTELLKQIDAAIIAVPTIHHYEVARECLEQGIALLIEKPIVNDVDQANALLQLAEQKQTLIQVGHIERFNPVFEEVQRRTMQPRMITCQRLSPYTGRSTDIGVVLDLMIHDLDMILTMVRSPIRSVSASGVSVFGNHEDLAQAQLTFENGCVASVRASRVHHEPARQMEIWSPEGFVKLDFHQKEITFTQADEKLHQTMLSARNVDNNVNVISPQQLMSQFFHTTTQVCEQQGPDQLTRELQEFVASLRQQTKPRVTGEQGRNALVLANHILRSLKQHRWSAEEDGPRGPHQLPTPLGPLFIPNTRTAA